MTNECVKSAFPRYVSLILAHEGLPPNPGSHSGVYLREFNASAGRRVEALVLPSDEVTFLFDDARQQLIDLHRRDCCEQARGRHESQGAVRLHLQMEVSSI